MSWLSSIFKDKQPEIQTKTYTDPLKDNVANPLSKFLGNEIGRGLPRFDQPTPGIDENVTNRYNEFLSMNANDWFDKYVDDPQTKSFKENFDANFTESYAGSLRGSGRYRNMEDNINKFEQDLSGQRYIANKELPGLQLDAATKYYDLQYKKYDADYKAWADSLPENNPVLKQAMDFLSSGTDSGTTLLAQGIPGKNAPGFDLIGTILGFLK